jgi:cell division septation protein DedD
MGIKTDHVSYAECDGATGNLRAPVCNTAGPESWDSPEDAAKLAVAEHGWVQEGRKYFCPIHAPRQVATPVAPRPRKVKPEAEQHQEHTEQQGEGQQ